MVQLIGLVVFIAIMGIIVLGGTNYVKLDKFTELSLKSEILNNYQILKQGQMLYREHTDSYLPLVDWKVSFAKYAFVPKDTLDLTWDYNKNGIGYYFCLTGTIEDPSLYNAILKSGEKLGTDSFYVNETCGSTTNFSLIPDFSTTPTVSATFFIK